MLNRFNNWCKENSLHVKEIDDYTYELNDKKYLLLIEKEEKIIDSKFSLILNTYEKLKLEGVDFLVFLWGEKFYYTPVDKTKNLDFTIFRYIGTRDDLDESYPFLGLHGKYELLNGTRDYPDWVDKARFLKIKTLGICEKNTLAGTLSFQTTCLKKKIKSIIGETISIKLSNDNIVLGKLFVVNEFGWRNLLLVNTEINVINSSCFIDEEKLLSLSQGLIFIFDPAYHPFSEDSIKKYSEKFFKVFYQFSSVSYINDSSDKDFLLETQKYLQNSLISPILISDAYYLEKDDYEIKSILNSLSGSRDLLSQDQYFKTDEENLVLLNDLFDSDSFDIVISESINSLYVIESLCNFVIPTGVFKLPGYILNPQESVIYKTNEDLFFELVTQGFQKNIVELGLDEELYYSRLELELDIIQRGGFIDYFLILWDIIRFCNENNILTGLGRGCFLPGSTVLLKDGSTKLIEEVVGGDILENYFSGTTQVNKTWEYQVEEEIVELIFDNGTSIKCTKDHKIYTLTRGWIEADKLLESDEISFIN